MITYQNIKKLIEKGRYTYDDMLSKMDVFLLNDRITEAEYNELKTAITAHQYEAITGEAYGGDNTHE